MENNDMEDDAIRKQKIKEMEIHLRKHVRKN